MGKEAEEAGRLAAAPCAQRANQGDAGASIQI